MKYIFTLTIALSSLYFSFAQTTVINEDFSGGFNGFTAVDFTDAADVWTATGGYVEMNGFGGSDDEDWLISPAINMDTQGDEYLMFDYNDQYDGALIELYYSTDYSGGGTVVDVQNATWTQIPLNVIDINATACFSTLFQYHKAIDVSGVSGASVYYAFRYTGLSGQSKQYRLDNFRIQADYYGSVNTFLSAGGSCEPLMDTIHSTVKTVPNVVRYTSSVYDIWDALLVTDRRMNDAGTGEIVWDMFTDIPTGTGEFEFDHCNDRDQGSCPGGEGQCYNREHTLPRSWWGGGTAYPSDTMNFDLHHITPSDRQMNTNKLNYPPGYVTNAVTTGSNGFKVGTNPSYPNCSSNFFEPIDAYKGDYARMYLYMAVRYKGQVATWETLNSLGDCALDGTSYTVYEPWLLEVLLEWNAMDAVSQKEIDRNNAIYAIQGNRNPFIDNPQWVDYIWGDTLGNACSTLVNPCTTTYGTDVVTACNSYTWIDGNTYTASNASATDTLLNAAGCDSIVTLNLTLYTSPTGTDVVTACDSYVWIDGNTYTSSNNSATHTISGGAANGCDSIVTLDLTMYTSTTGTDVITACDSYTWMDGITYTASNNTATHTLTNAAGCDSIVTLDLTINTSTFGTDVISTCYSHTWIDGVTYTSSNNTATHTLTNAAGCDSIVTLDLTIHTVTTGTDVITACGPITWIDGNTYASDNNTATYTLTNSNGCDSIVTLDLTISTFATGTDVVSACNSYTWIDGNTYTTSNNTATHTISGGSVNGCDSIVTLNLTLGNSNSGTDVVTACDAFTWIDGNTYTTSNNTATFTVTNASGCDSLVTLDLTINSSTTGTDIVTACDAYTWMDGNTYTTANNTATWTLTNAAGCDSVITLDLTINTSTSGTDVVTACDTYTWMDGVTYTSSNNTATHTISGGAANGCDSIVTLDLTILTSTSGTETVTACDSYTWIDGNTYTASTNTVTHVLTNAAGCDSIVTLDLTINATTFGTDAVTACDSYTWMDGNTYTSSNNAATYTTVNSAGCDSVITLDLTLNTSTASTLNETALDAYTLNGQTYTSSGTYTQTITNAAGCDSTITLNLTVEYTGLEEEGFTLIKIVPNPSQGTFELNVEDAGIEIRSLAMIDMKGAVVQQLNPMDQKHNVASLNPGVYYLLVETSEKRYFLKFYLN